VCCIADNVAIVSKLNTRKKEKEMYVDPNNTRHCSGLCLQQWHRVRVRCGGLGCVA